MSSRPVTQRLSRSEAAAAQRQNQRRQQLQANFDNRNRRGGRQQNVDMMDATSTSTPQGRRAAGSTPSGPLHKQNVTVRVEGFANVQEKDVIDYLRRHSRKTLNIVSQHFDGATLEIVLRNPAQAKAVTLLNGKSLNNHKLSIYVHHGLSPEHQTILQQYMHAHYLGDINMLSLSNLNAEPSFTQANLRPNFGNRVFAHAVLKIIRTDFPQLVTLDLSSNGIATLAHLSTLFTSAPNLINLSLANNRIANISELDHLRDLKLRELQLANNPLVTSVGMPTLKREMSRRFPSLRLLDSETIQTIQFAAVDAATGDTVAVLPPEKLFLYDSAETKSLAVDVVQNYLSAYDHGRRADLAAIYADDSLFSLTLVVGKGPTDRSYLPHSRNLKFGNRRPEPSEWDKRVRNIKVGGAEIAKQLASLPPTQHVAESFSIDAWQESIPNPLMFVLFHGEFVENPGTKNEVKRSFDRTFVLRPAPPGSPFPVHIVNDMLFIRDHSTKFLTAKSDILAQMTRETGLDQSAALQLLQASDWDPAAAAAQLQQAPPPTA